MHHLIRLGFVQSFVVSSKSGRKEEEEEKGELDLGLEVFVVARLSSSFSSPCHDLDQIRFLKS